MSDSSQAGRGVDGAVALVTGANGGIGSALVEALLERGARRVYAAARDLGKLDAVLALDPARVVALELDLTRADLIEAAPAQAPDVTLLINNAGIADFHPGLDIPHGVWVEQMEVNFFGPLQVIRAFLPVLERNGGGAVLNVGSLQSLAGTYGLDAYSASKAALLSMTQSLRLPLSQRGIFLCAAFPGPVDTPIIAHLDISKAVPSAVAGEMLDGLEGGREDIFPCPISRLFEPMWRSDPKAFERVFNDHPQLDAYIAQAEREGRVQVVAPTG